MYLPRLLTLLAWGAVIGLAVVSANYPALRSMAREGSKWAGALSLLEVSLVALLWLAVIVAGVVGIRRWSRDPAAVRIETTILVLASLSLVAKAMFAIATSFDTKSLLSILPFPLTVPDTSALASVFCLAASLGVLIKSDHPLSFEALAVPAVAYLFPPALTGLWMGSDAVTSVTLWAVAASAAVLGPAFALTRDRLHVGFLAGIIGPMFVILLPTAALFAGLLATTAVFVPLARARTKAVFVAGADRIALIGAGLGLAACFGGALILMLSPTLRSQMERADLVLAMRPLPTILASCTAMFALCVLTSPLVAFSLLAAALIVPFVGTLAYETQCGVIGGSVPIAIAATLARAEWQRSSADARSQRINLVAVVVLFGIGCACAAIPHPPTFNL